MPKYRNKCKYEVPYGTFVKDWEVIGSLCCPKEHTPDGDLLRITRSLIKDPPKWRSATKVE